MPARRRISRKPTGSARLTRTGRHPRGRPQGHDLEAVRDHGRAHLSLRHHPCATARRPRASISVARQVAHRAGARPARHRLCRGRLARRQPDRRCVLRRPAGTAARPLHRLRHDAAAGAQRRQRSGPAGLLDRRRAAVCLVGKTWDFHVDVGARRPAATRIST